MAVVFCVLYWFDFWAWAAELREPAFSNVLLDVHMYTAFDGFTDATDDDRVTAAARGFGCRLLQHSGHHPMLVGEFALAVDARATKVTQAYVDAQMLSFGSSLGSYFWTMQMDAGAAMAERNAGGDKIGPSPQWDFVKAIEANPNMNADGTLSPYHFPDFARHYPSASGASTLATLLLEERRVTGWPDDPPRSRTSQPPRQPPPPPPIWELPSAFADEATPPCPYVSSTGSALLVGAVLTSLFVCCLGGVHCNRRRRRWGERRKTRSHMRAMAMRSPLASPLF